MRRLPGSVALLVLLVLSSAPARAQLVDGGEVELSLNARSVAGAARAEQAAWVTLSLPLDALARSVALAGPPSKLMVGQAPALPPPARSEAQSTGAAEAPAVPLGPPESQPPVLGFTQLRALSHFARQAAAVALSAAGARRERARLDALSARSRASGALPELRLRAKRSTDQALRWAPTSDDPYRVTQADGAGTTLELSATFQLARLLFTREELSVERSREQAGRARLEVEQRVLTALLGLVHARQLACAREEAEGRELQLLRLVEHFTALDVLTAGWFSAHAARLAQGVWGFSEAVLGQCAPAPPPGTTNPVATLATSG
jgi:hypothetical protein